MCGLDLCRSVGLLNGCRTSSPGAIRLGNIAGWMSQHVCMGFGVMDIGYVILLLLVLVHGATAVFLYFRARQQEPTVPEEAQEMPQEEPEGP